MRTILPILALVLVILALWWLKRDADVLWMERSCANSGAFWIGDGGCIRVRAGGMLQLPDY